MLYRNDAFGSGVECLSIADRRWLIEMRDPKSHRNWGLPYWGFLKLKRDPLQTNARNPYVLYLKKTVSPGIGSDEVVIGYIS